MQLWEGGFNYPITMTTLHMILKVLMSRIWCYFKGIHIAPLAWRTYMRVIVPIGVLTSLDIMLSNLSIPLIPLSLYTALKTTVPVWSFIMTVAFGIEAFQWRTFWSIACVVGGLALAVEFRVDGSILGVILVLVASLSGGLRWVLTQVLLEVDPCSSDIMVAIYRFSPISAVFLLPLMLYFEWGSLSNSKFASNPFAMDAFGFSSCGGLISIALIAFEIYILRATTAVSLGILGQFKEILQILLSIAIYRERMTVQTGIGLTISIIAANFYRLIKQGYFDASRGRGGEGAIVEMSLRKTKSKGSGDSHVNISTYNPLSSTSHSEDSGADMMDMHAGLDVFLEVDSDGELESDHDDMLLF